MKKFISYLLIFLSIFSFAQKPDNALQGYYGIKGNGGLYGSFNFDGNGKVLIGNMAHGDYFTRNDSLIIYPDKDIFIFKIKGKELHGISTWVENEVWKFNKDSISVNNRKNPELSQKKAELLAEYYDKKKNQGDLAALFDPDFSSFNTKLCDKGLAKSCLDLFGAKMLEVTPGLLTGKDLSKQNIQPHPELLALAQKIIDMGEPEGHTSLGSYLYAIGRTEEGEKEWNKAIEKGSRKAFQGKALMEFSKGLEEK
ncbi:hypothetical protein [Elizabethkingia anophelis]|uniref:hypothetical protein n=1 Tax=Elizabethkingia anophelis TaxID=1117645 RepID=UPI0023E9347A|nr:hypothetical protein [Elizabethkingia anophelis]GJN62603.1 hypothetical protein ELAK_27530 [Elizabethkingia anophelis]HDP3253849.1 hypothetical protein [Elizabethkingia anophelis]